MLRTEGMPVTAGTPTTKGTPTMVATPGAQEQKRKYFESETGAPYGQYSRVPTHAVSLQTGRKFGGKIQTEHRI
jgi:hypothetical protein